MAPRQTAGLANDGRRIEAARPAGRARRSLNWWRLGALVAVVAVCAVGWWLILIVFAAGMAAWLMPPARFDHEPTRPYEVRYRQAALFDMYCGTNHPKVGGCAVEKDGTCYITIRQELGRTARAAVLRHEKGHCNGWPRSHPIETAARR